jgi:hypothetical protein
MATVRATTTGLIRDAGRALPLILLLGFGPLAIVAPLVHSDHVAAAWVTIATALVGLAIARTGTAPRRPARHCSTVQRINRRAAVVLPLSAVALSTLMATIAASVA